MSSTPPEAPLAPQAWCRRILKSLSQQKVEGREAGYLEMLLTYFIELNPAAEAFDGLLQQFCGDSRPGIAEAASLLQRSWQRGRAPAAAPVGMPSLQEALRTLGSMLDEAKARGAFIVVEAERLVLHPFGGVALTLGPRELHQEIGARTALRGQIERPTAGPGRFEPALRAVGAALDRAPAQSFEVVATRRTVVVEGSAGFHAVYAADELDALIDAATPRPRPPDA